MRRWLLLAFLFCVAGIAYANPVTFDPVGSIGFIYVLGSSVVVEAAIVTILLFFWGMEPKPVYVTLILGNLVLYFAAFRPLLQVVPNLWIAEGIIVILEGTLIKVLTHYDTFCQNTFRPLRWGYAYIIAAIGNLVSYYVGVVMDGDHSQTDWVHLVF